MSEQSRRDVIRDRLFSQIRDLIGKEWIGPDGVYYPFTNKRGQLLCPMGLYFAEDEEPASEMHEIEPWPWSSSMDKYLKGEYKGTETKDVWLKKIAAYYRVENCILLGPTYHKEAHTARGRVVCRWYQAKAYGTPAVVAFYEGLNDQLRVKIIPQWRIPAS